MLKCYQVIYNSNVLWYVLFQFGLFLFGIQCTCIHKLITLFLFCLILATRATQPQCAGLSLASRADTDARGASFPLDTGDSPRTSWKNHRHAVGD